MLILAYKISPQYEHLGTGYYSLVIGYAKLIGSSKPHRNNLGKMRIVIVGLGAGGFSAAFSARKQNKEAEISVVDNLNAINDKFDIITMWHVL